MISALIREFLIPLLIFLFLRMLLRGLFAGLRRPSARPFPNPTQPQPVKTGGVLHKDPVCGTYVPADTAITRNIGGEMLYFCSPECRDRYQEAK